MYFTEVGPSTSAGASILSALGASNNFLAAEVSVLASWTYFDKGEGTNEGYVTNLYEDILARDPDGSGLTYWTNALNSATKTRAEVATTMIRGSEAAALRVRGSTAMTTCTDTVLVSSAGLSAGSYCLILDRMADPSGASYWTGQLTGSGQLTALWSQLAGSTEYFNHAQ